MLKLFYAVAFLIAITTMVIAASGLIDKPIVSEETFTFLDPILTGLLVVVISATAVLYKKD